MREDKDEPVEDVEDELGSFFDMDYEEEEEMADITSKFEVPPMSEEEFGKLQAEILERKARQMIAPPSSTTTTTTTVTTTTTTTTTVSSPPSLLAYLLDDNVVAGEIEDLPTK